MDIYGWVLTIYFAVGVSVSIPIFWGEFVARHPHAVNRGLLGMKDCLPRWAVILTFKKHAVVADLAVVPFVVALIALWPLGLWIKYGHYVCVKLVALKHRLGWKKRV